MERNTIPRPALMHIARLGFILLCMFMGASIAGGYEKSWWTGSLLGLLGSILFVLIEFGLGDLSFRRFSHGTIGLLVGITGAWLITRIGFFDTKGLAEYEDIRTIFELIIYLGLGFLGMMLALRTNKEEFSLLIPYVRFRQEASRDLPLIVDTEILIDSRLPRLFSSGFLNGTLLVPRFVVDELHDLSDSDHEVNALRGRRGLDCLDQMRSSSRIEVSIQDDLISSEKRVDLKLLTLAKDLDARLLTQDTNLIQSARVQNIRTLNLSDLISALRPVLTPGDEISILLVKEGKDQGQAVGYLSDGTMIVVNEARKKIGSMQEVVVVNSTKTNAGRLVFSELKASSRAQPYLRKPL